MDELDNKNDKLISMMAAVDAVQKYKCEHGYAYADCACDIEKDLKALPSAQPDRLTDDDFETIRIHLSAHKEELCNQRRWKEAEEYQRIIDRFMGFASAQPTQNNRVNSNNALDTISRQAAIDAMAELQGRASSKGELTGISKAWKKIKQLPPAQPDGWLEQNKDKILQAGMEGREIDFRIGGRLFAIREKAQ